MILGFAIYLEKLSGFTAGLAIAQFSEQLSNQEQRDACRQADNPVVYNYWSLLLRSEFMRGGCYADFQMTLAVARPQTGSG